VDGPGLRGYGALDRTTIGELTRGRQAALASLAAWSPVRGEGRDAVLGNNKHLEKKLREHGKSAPAKILAVKPTVWQVSHGDPWNPDVVVKLTLRLRPPGEVPFDAEVTAREAAGHWAYTTGDMVIALYDPADHSSVCVDAEATEAARAAKRDKAAAKDQGLGPGARRHGPA